MCVCAYVGAWVRGCVCGCAPNFAEVSKIVRDATGAGATTEHRNTSDHHKHQSRSSTARAPNTKKKIKKQ